MAKIFIIALVCWTFASTNSLLDCDSEGPGYFKFGAKTVANIKPGDSITFQGICFNMITVSATQNDTEFTVEVITSDHKGGHCVELVIVSAGNNSVRRPFFDAGHAVASFPYYLLSDEKKAYLEEKGFFILRGCDNLLNLPQNLFLTAKLFFGGLGTNPDIPIFGSKIPEYQLTANIDWTAKAAGYQWALLDGPVTVDIQKESIKSGDFLGIIRFDGMENLIHITSGSRASHCAMALWRDGELWIVESRDSWSWPRKGIQKNKFDEWLQWAVNADLNVVLLPLKEELRPQFDVEKAWQEFDRLEGHPYGFSNFIFGLLDTAKDNLPDYFDPVFLSIVANDVGIFLPNQLKTIAYDGLNMRLGTESLEAFQIWEEIFRRKTTLQEVMEQVEVEGWEYASGESYVCSSFLVRLYKVGGLFPNLIINSTEFTPKDVYELNIFDVSGKNVPIECHGFAPRGYCQITGKVDFDLGKVSWVEPYSHMAENCPTVPPNYDRTEGC